MAGHAVCSECQEVFRGKRLINLQVTITARGLIERRSITIYVTISTGKCGSICLGLMSCQHEGNRAVVKAGRTPAVWSMACAALVTKRAGVRIILGVAGGTVHGCAFEDAILVALAAVHIEMSAGQLEGREIVVKGRRSPGGGGMA